MDELERCPFCGGEALLLETSESVWDLKPHDFAVICRTCHAGTRRYFSTEAEAIEAWNRRADNG